MEHKIIGPGPYRATKLWNEIIEIFRARMPLRRHRIHFKTYDNCFSAFEAIVCLHDLLRDNQNFGPDVTRNQTIQLLKKFKKNHVIEDVKGRWGQEDFEDNGYLYRFPPSSPLKPYPKRSHFRAEIPRFPDWSEYEAITSNDHTTMRPIVMNSEMWYKRHSIAIGEVPACRLVHRKTLTEANLEEIWKTMTMTHLQKILGLDSMEDVLESKFVNPKHIIYNVYSTNKQGVVILEDKSKELPHWVLSAMKCLANWPSSTDLNRPMYLGFERDVFKTIADYHGQMKEPLLTFQLFDAFVSILALSGLVSVPQQTKERNTSKNYAPHTRVTPNGHKMNSFLSSSPSIENLMISLTSKPSRLSCEVNVSLFSTVDSNRSHLSKSGGEGLQQHRSSWLTNHIRSLQRDKINTAPVNYQVSNTEDTTEREKENEYQKINCDASLQRLREVRRAAANPWVSTSRYFSIENLPDMDELERKPLCRLPSVSNFPVRTASAAAASVQNWKRSQSARYLPTLHEAYGPNPKIQSLHCKSCKDGHCRGFMSMISLPKGAPATEYTRLSPFQQSAKLNPFPPLTAYSSCSNILCKNPMDGSTAFVIDDHQDTLYSNTIPAISSFSGSVLENGTIHGHLPGSPFKLVHKYTSVSSLLQKRQVAVEALQVCCLLLPPENRRKLQLLMRMMAKISLNREMPSLCETISARMLMVQTFSRCILRSKDEVDLDELLASRLVTFMMDNYQEILKIPVSLQTTVEDHVAHLRRVKIKYPGADMDTTIPSMPTQPFVPRASADQFEYQKINSAPEPLATVLEEIITNAKLSTKDKKKKLKQFQKSYPEVYRKRLPTPESEAALFPEKVKTKPQLMFFTLKNPFQPFHRTRSFRM